MREKKKEKNQNKQVDKKHAPPVSYLCTNPGGRDIDWTWNVNSWASTILCCHFYNTFPRFLCLNHLPPLVDLSS